LREMVNWSQPRVQFVSTDTRDVGSESNGQRLVFESRSSEKI